MNKTYLIYLDSVFMEEVSKLKQAIDEAKHYINTQQGNIAEVWSLNLDTDKSTEVYTVGNKNHSDNYNIEVLA